MRSFTQLITAAAALGAATVFAAPAAVPEEQNLAARGTGGKATFFEPGLGACGWQSGSDDMIVAITSQMWDNGAHCGKWLTIDHNGAKVAAKVVDECPTCPSAGSLDLSPAVFKKLASLDKGMIDINWSYNN
ncbi:unnamed protein product [Parajaminaea phylloscopi]